MDKSRTRSKPLSKEKHSEKVRDQSPKVSQTDSKSWMHYKPTTMRYGGNIWSSFSSSRGIAKSDQIPLPPIHENSGIVRIRGDSIHAFTDTLDKKFRQNYSGNRGEVMKAEVTKLRRTIGNDQWQFQQNVEVVHEQEVVILE